MTLLILFVVIEFVLVIFSAVFYSRMKKADKKFSKLNAAYVELTAQEKREQKRKQKKKSDEESKALSSLQEIIVAAGVEVEPQKFLILWICAAVIPFVLLVLVVGNLAGGIIVGLIGAIAPIVFLKFKSAKRRELFGYQLGDAMPMMSENLRSGFTLQSSLEGITKNFPDPLRGEFDRCLIELKFGMPLSESLANMADRVDNSDLRLLASAIQIQQTAGGSLSVIIDAIADTINSRITLRKYIKSITAQSRLSGIVIGVLPVGLFALISVMNPTYMSVFFEEPIGWAALGCCVASLVIGFLVMRKIYTIKIY